MRPFNKTTLVTTLVRPRPFSTLCPTPLGKSPVCLLPDFQIALTYSILKLKSIVIPPDKMT